MTKGQKGKKCMFCFALAGPYATYSSAEAGRALPNAEARCRQPHQLPRRR